MRVEGSRLPGDSLIVVPCSAQMRIGLHQVADHAGQSADTSQPGEPGKSAPVGGRGLAIGRVDSPVVKFQLVAIAVR